MKKLALKRLTASDLTLFEWHFRNKNAGNQKAINLNRNVFADKLYPSLPLVAQSHGGRLPLDLYILGPGMHGCLNLQRKIIKFGTYKNWRLDGEFISDPLDMPDRFHALADGDFVVLEFRGELQPESATALFVARAVTEDATLHGQLEALLGQKSMRQVTVEEIEHAITAAGTSEQHPASEFVLESDIEDAAANGFAGTTRLARRRSGRKLSAQDLLLSIENAHRIGQQGEEIVHDWLHDLADSGSVSDVTWSSQDNAVSPYDFEITRDGRKTLLEVKATAGDFGRTMHISFAELHRMATGPEPYEIVRVFAVKERSAKCRIARNVGPWAKKVITTLSSIPEGITVDAISVQPEILTFDNEVHEIRLRIETDEETEETTPSQG